VDATDRRGNPLPAESVSRIGQWGFRMKLHAPPLVSVLLCLVLLATSLAPRAHAQDATGLDGVQAAYHDLLDLFYKPLDPRDLLQAGWATLGSDADRRGASAPGPLPNLPSDADAAFAIFSGIYANYVAGLPPGDVILSADGQDLSSADTPSLAAALTGPQGSTVNLSIDRGTGPQSITVIRGPYYFPPLESRVLPDGVGYLRLSDFVISGT